MRGRGRLNGQKALFSVGITKQTPKPFRRKLLRCQSPATPCPSPSPRGPRQHPSTLAGVTVHPKQEPSTELQLQKPRTARRGSTHFMVPTKADPKHLLLCLLCHLSQWLCPRLILLRMGKLPHLHLSCLRPCSLFLESQRQEFRIPLPLCRDRSSRQCPTSCLPEPDNK